jgi:hypothetical protein
MLPLLPFMSALFNCLIGMEDPSLGQILLENDDML